MIDRIIDDEGKKNGNGKHKDQYDGFYYGSYLEFFQPSLESFEKHLSHFLSLNFQNNI